MKRVTRQFLKDHECYALAGAFILTGNTLKVLMAKTETPVRWLELELDINHRTMSRYLANEEKPLSVVITIAVLRKLQDRFDNRHKIMKIPAYHPGAQAA